MLLFIAVASVLQATGQDNTYIVSGTITGLPDGDLLPGAHIAISNSADDIGSAAASGVDGTFIVGNVVPGHYKLSMNYVGYRTLEQTIQVQNEGLELSDLLLTEEIVLIDEVTVTRRAAFGQQWGDNTTQFNAKSFKTAPDASAEDLVTKMRALLFWTALCKRREKK